LNQNEFAVLINKVINSGPIQVLRLFSPRKKLIKKNPVSGVPLFAHGQRPDLPTNARVQRSGEDGDSQPYRGHDPLGQDQRSLGAHAAAFSQRRDFDPENGSERGVASVHIMDMILTLRVGQKEAPLQYTL
jgi:hypothetical protein